MKIIITGAHGQLGTELQKILSQNRSELGEIPEAFHHADVTAVDVEELDITDWVQTLAFLQMEQPDVIFNCAAMTNVDGCETNREVAMQVNAIGARNIARAAEAVGAKLVHVSTDYVFPGDGDRPYVEWDVCHPTSIYGLSKRLGEEYVQQFCTKYFSARTAWLYGYVGKNFVRTMIRLAKERGAVTVVNDQFGNPTSAADLAHQLLKIADSEEYGVYHCTNNGTCSWYEFTVKIMEVFGLDCKVTPCTTQEYNSPTKRPAYSSLDNMMLRCTIGDEMRGWEEAIESFAAHDLNEVTR